MADISEEARTMYGIATNGADSLANSHI